MQSVFKLLFCTFIFLSPVYVSAQFDGDFNQKIIAFGEASHGDKGVYEARIKLVNQLSNRDTLPIHVFVEMYQGATYAMQEYFKKEIDSAQLLKELGFYGLQTDAFFNLLHTCHSKKVRFYGVDMQDHISSLNHIEKILLQSVISDSSIFHNIHSLKKYFPKEFRNSQNKDSLMRFYEFEFEQLKSGILNYQHSILSAQHSDWFFDIELPLEIVKQCLHANPIGDDWKSFQYRDSCMARNVIETEKHLNGTCLFFAANIHTSRSEKTCGWHLSNHYGKNYFSIAYQFHSGSALSYALRDGKSVYIPITFKAMAKSFPEKLKENNINGYLDFSKITNPKLKRVVNKKIYVLDFGAYLREPERRNYFYMIPSKMYDAVYFDLVSKASLLLK